MHALQIVRACVCVRAADTAQDIGIPANVYGPEAHLTSIVRDALLEKANPVNPEPFGRQTPETLNFMKPRSP